MRLRLNRKKLLRARELLGYGIEKVAEEAGVSKNSVLRAEHEEDIRPVTARKIAAALHVSVADLIGESDILKAQALRSDALGDVHDPRASELRRENYLLTLLSYAARRNIRWKKDLAERFGEKRRLDFLGWAREVMESMKIFSDALERNDVFNTGLGPLSKQEEEYQKLLLEEQRKMVLLWKQILTAFSECLDQLENLIDEIYRLEMEHYNEEFQRIVAANFPELQGLAARG
jgi:transcriptional regulator with XRE-family HTH domain